MTSSQRRFRAKIQGIGSEGKPRVSEEGAFTSVYERHFEGITTEDEQEHYLPTIWSFASVAFPLFASTLGPIACLFSICALTQSWRTSKPSGVQIPDPGWLLALKIVSLVLALLANLLLLFNFAKRISYTIAQPLTIIFWYLSCILLLVPVVITHTTLLHRQSSYVLSQSYYYAFIATIIYFVISTLLLINLLGSCIFYAYPPSLAPLDRPQRTLMLQTIIFSAYLALGGAIYSSIESWTFVDGLYWADYTLLTIGFGSDFPLTDTIGRMVLIPFMAVGLLIIGLIVNSIRTLVIEHAHGHISKRRLHKEKKKWDQVIEKMRNGTEEEVNEAERKIMKATKRWWRWKQMSMREVMEDDSEKTKWRIREFMLMRYIEERARKMDGYIALAFSFLFFGIVWIGGSVVFWACQLRDPTPWTYPNSLYFTYTSILTIGYGDFYPSTKSARPFCVIWSLLAIPSVTVLIQNIGETVAGHVENGVEWLGSRSILPEKCSRAPQKTEEKRSEDGEGGDDTCERQVSVQMMPIVEHSKKIKGKGKRRLLVEEDVGGTPPQPLSPPPPPQPTMISGTTQQLSEIPLPLSVRLTKGITKASKDAAKGPMIRYTWHEWVQWLRLMDEAGEMLGVCRYYRRIGDCDATDAQLSSGQVPSSSRTHDDRQQHRKQQYADSTDRRTEGRIIRTATTLVDRWGWGWLDDSGPLFSSMTESQWVLDRFCRLFEGVVEKESEGWRMERDEAEGER